MLNKEDRAIIERHHLNRIRSILAGYVEQDCQIWYSIDGRSLEIESDCIQFGLNITEKWNQALEQLYVATGRKYYTVTIDGTEIINGRIVMKRQKPSAAQWWKEIRRIIDREL